MNPFQKMMELKKKLGDKGKAAMPPVGKEAPTKAKSEKMPFPPKGKKC